LRFHGSSRFVARYAGRSHAHCHFLCASVSPWLILSFAGLAAFAFKFFVIFMLFVAS